MKKLLMVLSLFAVVAFTTTSAKAQITTGEQVLAAAGNLVNVQVGNVILTDVIDVDIANVLNNNDVRVLTDFLNNLSIDNVLNNLLRDADILNKNQVVIGVIVNALGQTVAVVTDAANLKGQKSKK
jgi:hypothetical protein